MDSITVYDGESYTFPECAFEAPDGQIFNGWRMSGDDNYSYAPEETVKIYQNYICGDKIIVTALWKNADRAKIDTDPLALEPAYNGSAQALVSAGNVTNGAMQYYLGADSTTVPTSGWSADIPKETLPGTYYVWYRAKGDATHSNSKAACCEAKISKAPLTVTAKAKTVTYGDAPANDGVTYSGFVNGETEALLGGTLAYDYNYVQYGNAGSYTITPKGLTADNYAFTYVSGTLTVNKKPVTVTAKDQTVNEGGEIAAGLDMAALTGALEGHVLSEVKLISNPEKGSITPSAAVIKDAAGNDVSANYEIGYEPGKLNVIGKVTRKVTFKVVNGSWDDETVADKYVILTGFEGDTLKLAAADIPAVGSKPADACKAGAWDTEPKVDTVITEDVTYTYTYAKKTEISARVTFKVVNGAWDDATTEDKVVTLKGYEGDTLKLAAADIPAVGTKPAEGYQAGTWDTEPAADTVITADTAYTYTYAEVEPEPIPKGGILLPVISKVQKTAMTVSWNKIKSAEGYEVFYGPCGEDSHNAKVVRVSAEKTKCRLKNLKKKGVKSYKVWVRAYVVREGKRIPICTSLKIDSFMKGASTVFTNPKSVSLGTKQIPLAVGKKAKITASVEKEESGKKLTSHLPELRYVSSNTGVASVAEDGTVKGVGNGKCKVYVIAPNGIYKAVQVTVGVEAEKLSFTEKQVKVKAGEELDLKALLKADPKGAYLELKWESKDKKIAKVGKDGVVKGRKKGKTKITVEDKASGLKATILVIVTD